MQPFLKSLSSSGQEQNKNSALQCISFALFREYARKKRGFYLFIADFGPDFQFSIGPIRQYNPCEKKKMKKKYDIIEPILRLSLGLSLSPGLSLSLSLDWN